MGLAFCENGIAQSGESEACLPHVALDNQALLLEALHQLKLVVVHQCRVRDDNEGGADVQGLPDGSCAWDEMLVATKQGRAAPDEITTYRRGQ